MLAQDGERHHVALLFERRTITRTEIIDETGLKAAYFIAVDLEGLHIRFALLNLLGDIRYRWEENLEWKEPLDVSKLFAGMEKLQRNLDARQRNRILAAGIGYPGLLDAEGRLTSVNLGWHDFPLMAELREKASQFGMSDLTLFLEPDRHSAVRAERWAGSARGSQNGLLLFSERGVGVGIFVKGEPIEGSRNMAGELGHLTVESEAEDRCECGKHGCVEAIASSPNIIRQYARASGRRASDLRITDVFEKARQKEPGAVAVIDRASRALGLAVSRAINLLNPEILILGGDLALGEDILLPRITKEAARHALPELMKDLQITASLLGSDMRLKGAGALAFQKSLNDPDLLKKMCSPVHLRQVRAG